MLARVRGIICSGWKSQERAAEHCCHRTVSSREVDLAELIVGEVGAGESMERYGTLSSVNIQIQVLAGRALVCSNTHWSRMTRFGNTAVPCGCTSRAWVGCSFPYTSALEERSQGVGRARARGGGVRNPARSTPLLHQQRQRQQRNNRGCSGTATAAVSMLRTGACNSHNNPCQPLRIGWGACVAEPT